MQLPKLVHFERHEIQLQTSRQVALLLRLCPTGTCIGVYQSPKAVWEGATNWSLTQGEIHQSEMMYRTHPAAVAAARLLRDELGVAQSFDEFHYVGSVARCQSRQPGMTDYHLVVCVARTREVIKNPVEVASFRWENVLGCQAALQAGGFMSEQKSSLMLAGLHAIVHRWEGMPSQFASVIAKAPWRHVFLRPMDYVAA